MLKITDFSKTTRGRGKGGFPFEPGILPGDILIYQT